jgi:hypothetical protein
MRDCDGRRMRGKKGGGGGRRVGGGGGRLSLNAQANNRILVHEVKVIIPSSWMGPEIERCAESLAYQGGSFHGG